MKTTVYANLLLLPLALLCTSLYWAGVVYLVALVYASVSSERVSKIWTAYYRKVLQVENRLK